MVTNQFRTGQQRELEGEGRGTKEGRSASFNSVLSDAGLAREERRHSPDVLVSREEPGELRSDDLDDVSKHWEVRKRERKEKEPRKQRRKVSLKIIWDERGPFETE